MATIREIKEDFFYLYVIEIAFMIALIFNNVYLRNYIFAFRYFLIFLGVFILEDKVYRALMIAKARSLKDKFLLMEDYKSRGKASLTIALVILIFSSSWGIISFLSGFWENSVKFSAELTYIMPWYIGIYVGWLTYLSYLKGHYRRIILRLLKKGEEKLKIYHLMLIHSGGGIIALISLRPLGEKEREKLKKEIIAHTQDFHWNGMKVAIEEEKGLKLALVYQGKITQRLRVKMKDTLRKILIAHPSVKDGKVDVEEAYDIENTMRRNILR